MRTRVSRWRGVAGGVVLATLWTGPALADPTARLSFRATPATLDLRLRVRSVSAGTEVECVAPCELEFPSGEVWLSLAKPGQDAPGRQRWVASAGHHALRGHYQDRSSLRTAGWWVFGANAALLLASIGVFLSYDWGSCDENLSFPGSAPCRDADRTPAYLGVIGIGTSLLGMITGGVLAAQPDRAWIMP